MMHATTILAVRHKGKIVIGGDGLVIYSQSGYNQSTMVAMIEEGLSNLVLDMDT